MPTAETSGNGASGGTWQQPHAERSLADHGRQIQHDAQALAAAVQDATAGLEGCLTAQVTRRPYSTLGVAAGIGYALGGGLSAQLTAIVLGAATRLAIALAARQLGDRLVPNGSASIQNKTS
jgi:ElaB/YqjD/DUF883 family membrane-anchored ribosome-binding protein